MSGKGIARVPIGERHRHAEVADVATATAPVWTTGERARLHPLVVNRTRPVSPLLFASVSMSLSPLIVPYKANGGLFSFPVERLLPVERRPGFQVFGGFSCRVD